MPILYATMPIVTCPFCGNNFQYDDYYRLSSGDEIECPDCDKVMYLLSVDTIIQARIGTEP